jgi:hypothetical protein
MQSDHEICNKIPQHVFCEQTFEPTKAWAQRLWSYICSRASSLPNPFPSLHTFVYIHIFFSLSVFSPAFSLIPIKRKETGLPSFKIIHCCNIKACMRYIIWISSSSGAALSKVNKNLYYYNFHCNIITLPHHKKKNASRWNIKNRKTYHGFHQRNQFLSSALWLIIIITNLNKQTDCARPLIKSSKTTMI